MGYTINKDPSCSHSMTTRRRKRNQTRRDLNTNIQKFRELYYRKKRKSELGENDIELLAHSKDENEDAKSVPLSTTVLTENKLVTPYVSIHPSNVPENPVPSETSNSPITEHEDFRVSDSEPECGVTREFLPHVLEISSISSLRQLAISGADKYPSNRESTPVDIQHKTLAAQHIPVSTNGHRSNMSNSESEEEVELFECPKCDRCYSNKYNLNRHMLSHKEYGKFACPKCKKPYSCTEHLEKHIASNTCEIEYICSTCSRSFSRKDNLKEHLHTHSKVKPYICSTCNKSFVSKRYLSEHVKIHSSKRPFSCSICWRKYASRSDRNKHLKTHSTERPYTCDICLDTFKSKKYLKRHVQTHTNDVREKRFSCEYCSQLFTTMKYLQSHVKAAHCETTPSSKAPRTPWNSELEHTKKEKNMKADTEWTKIKKKLDKFNEERSIEKETHKIEVLQTKVDDLRLTLNLRKRTNTSYAEIDDDEIEEETENEIVSVRKTHRRKQSRKEERKDNDTDESRGKPKDKGKFKRQPIERPKLITKTTHRELHAERKTYEKITTAQSKKPKISDKQTKPTNHMGKCDGKRRKLREQENIKKNQGVDPSTELKAYIKEKQHQKHKRKQFENSLNQEETENLPKSSQFYKSIGNHMMKKRSPEEESMERNKRSGIECMEKRSIRQLEDKEHGVADAKKKLKVIQIVTKKETPQLTQVQHEVHGQELVKKSEDRKQPDTTPTEEGVLERQEVEEQGQNNQKHLEEQGHLQSEFIQRDKGFVETEATREETCCQEPEGKYVMEKHESDKHMDEKGIQQSEKTAINTKYQEQLVSYEDERLVCQEEEVFMDRQEEIRLIEENTKKEQGFTDLEHNLKGAQYRAESQAKINEDVNERRAYQEQIDTRNSDQNPIGEAVMEQIEQILMDRTICTQRESEGEIQEKSMKEKGEHLMKQKNETQSRVEIKQILEKIYAEDWQMEEEHFEENMMKLQEYQEEAEVNSMNFQEKRTKVVQSLKKERQLDETGEKMKERGQENILDLGLSENDIHPTKEKENLREIPNLAMIDDVRIGNHQDEIARHNPEYGIESLTNSINQEYFGRLVQETSTLENFDDGMNNLKDARSTEMMWSYPQEDEYEERSNDRMEPLRSQGREGEYQYPVRINETAYNRTNQGKKKGSLKQYSCSMCAASFNSKSLFYRHIRHPCCKAKDGWYTCPNCENSFPRKQDLIAHMHAAHPGVKQSFFCGFCNKYIPFGGSLMTHIREVHTPQTGTPARSSQNHQHMTMEVKKSGSSVGNTVHLNLEGKVNNSELLFNSTMKMNFEDKDHRETMGHRIQITIEDIPRDGKNDHRYGDELLNEAGSTTCDTLDHLAERDGTGWKSWKSWKRWDRWPKGAT